MIRTDNLLKKVGFYATLEILNIQGRAITLRTFYERLLKKGLYYNAFIRIKETMKEKKIIEIYYEKTNRTKRIRLTRKGMTIKQILNSLLEVME
ncbi:DNA binding protein [Varidnaviria sp.]|uniref:DNA binding protein n=1 Tax=Lokiarchaeia virus SkuldV1 TaxID=3058189 RepID=A0AA46MQ56_9VIRU|nr:DNA binding protein [Varidnaviria sp.]UPO70961.1 DNA binding protein [Lokiarchaeia virus SkuldV1]